MARWDKQGGKTKAKFDAGLARLSWRFRRRLTGLPPRSGFFVRTTQYRDERLRIFGWSVAFLFFVAVLLAVADAYGNAAKHRGSGLIHNLHVTISSPVVAAGAALFLLMSAASCMRRARLAWLTWAPGTISVADFTEASDLTGVTAAQLSATFRERLVLMRLDSASAAPGATPQEPVLDVGVGSSTDVFGVLLWLRKLALPQHSMALQGVVRERTQGPERYGVSVQITQTPSQAGPSVQIWDRTWERALQRAADAASAAILPRSRQCRGPWAAWQRYVMPPELLNAYENAAQLEQERRFDEAMHRYWDALALDPSNLTIRLALAQLQEKAGLFLAALTNYQRILAFGAPGSKLPPRGLYTRTAWRERDRTLRVAKYRAIVLISQPRIVENWNNSDPQIQAQLHAEFGALLGPLAIIKRRDPVADAISVAVVKLVSAERALDNEAANALASELAQCALRAAHELMRTLRHIAVRRTRLPLTRRTVALTKVAIDVRLGGELADVQQLDEDVKGAARWPLPLRRWQWHEHYNAACIYALAMRFAVDDDVRDELAPRAIARLERAITARDTEFVSGWRDWLVLEDPDLKTLRERDEFWSFAAMYFPRPLPRIGGAPSIPDDHYRLLESRYARELLCQIAGRFHDLWQERSQTQDHEDTHLMVDWCEAEGELWRHIYGVAQTRYDWRVRFLLLEKARALLHVGDELVVRFSSYHDERHANGDANLEKELAELQLEGIAEALTEHGDAAPQAGSFEVWMESLRSYDPHGPHTLAAQRWVSVCMEHADLWHRLAQWVGAGERGEVRREAELFGEQLERTVEAWREVGNEGGRFSRA